MTERRTKTKVPYTAQEMFDLVADVEQYPLFLPWCTGLRVVRRERRESDELIVADMIVAYKVFREQFRSEVTLNRDEKVIDVRYLDGPFEHLHNQWRFESLNGTDPEKSSTQNESSDEAKKGRGCLIDFYIVFQFRNALLQAAAGTVFEKAFGKMSQAFVNRAHMLHGRPDLAISDA